MNIQTAMHYLTRGCKVRLPHWKKTQHMMMGEHEPVVVYKGVVINDKPVFFMEVLLSDEWELFQE